MKSVQGMSRAGILLGLLACSVLLVGACSPSTTPSGTSDVRTDLPSAPPADDRAQVTAAYERFWAISRPLASQPPEHWERELRKIAVDPQLAQLVEGFKLLRERGITLYGQVAPRVTAVEVTGNHAQVTDCQDASNAGQADAATGKRQTVGVARSPVSARVVRDADGWKVAEITYPGGAC